MPVAAGNRRRRRPKGSRSADCPDTVWIFRRAGETAPDAAWSSFARPTPHTPYSAVSAASTPGNASHGAQTVRGPLSGGTAWFYGMDALGDTGTAMSSMAHIIHRHQPCEAACTGIWAPHERRGSRFRSSRP